MIARALGIATHDVLPFSAETREGRPQLWGRILRAVGNAPDIDAADEATNMEGGASPTPAAAPDPTSDPV